MKLRAIELKDMEEVTNFWNETVEEAKFFIDECQSSSETIWELFDQQTETVVAEVDHQIVGVYFIHPNLIGRCSHIANAVYIVSRHMRGKGVGKALVADSINRAKKHGFLGMQFNAVVCTNTSAINLYLSQGFRVIGTINNGFRMKNNTYTDTMIFLKYWGK